MIDCDIILANWKDIEGRKQYLSTMRNLLNRDDIKIKNIVQTGLNDCNFITTIIYEEKEMFDLSKARKEWEIEEEII